MKYAKKTYRNYKNRDKYSVEQTSFTVNTGEQTINELYQAVSTIVPATTVQGMRKVKHLTISLGTTANIGLIYWALVYVPAGYTPNYINSAGEMYEPNQFVMNCGLVDTDAGPQRIFSPISRNLNSGDSIALVVGTRSVGGAIFGVVKYAITLQ